MAMPQPSCAAQPLTALLVAAAGSGRRGIRTGMLRRRMTMTLTRRRCSCGWTTCSKVGSPPGQSPPGCPFPLRASPGDRGPPREMQQCSAVVGLQRMRRVQQGGARSRLGGAARRCETLLLVLPSLWPGWRACGGGGTEGGRRRRCLCSGAGHRHGRQRVSRRPASAAGACGAARVGQPRCGCAAACHICCGHPGSTLRCSRGRPQKFLPRP